MPLPPQFPLSGIRILDLSRLLPGPLGTMMLAEMGAEVIKIESPSRPDDIRMYPPLIGKESAYYHAVNRSKRSLSLNLRKPKAQEIFRKLLATADIVVESYRPGILKKAGLDYESVKAQFPQIIYVSVTGYGQEGPYTQKAGHDLNYIGYAGLLGLNGEKNGKLNIPGGQIADIAGGSYMTVIACLIALQKRQQTGKGEHVDVSMLDAVLPLLSLQYGSFFASGKAAKRGELPLSGGFPNYGVYECEDGGFMALGSLEPKFFQGFCMAVERPDLLQYFAPTPENVGKLRRELTKLFLSKPRSYWKEIAEQTDVCLSPALDLSEAAQDPHLQAREMFVSYEHPKHGSIKGIALPLRFMNDKLPKGAAAPSLGQDTKSILQELQLDDQLDELQTEGVV